MNNNLTVSLLSLLLGYFTGNINPAYLLSKIKGFDIRERGSGNAGASNAMITLGKFQGVICALFDILKAYVVTSFFKKYSTFVGIVAGAACIIGHMYPVIMEFRGGKGLACTAGTLLAYDGRIFACILTFEVILALVTSYICSIATSGSLLVMGTLYVREGLLVAFVMLPVVIAIWRKHLINFKRIWYGVEVKIRYLWARDEEEERVSGNWNKLSDEQRLYVQLPKLITKSE